MEELIKLISSRLGIDPATARTVVGKVDQIIAKRPMLKQLLESSDQ